MGREKKRAGRNQHSKAKSQPQLHEVLAARKAAAVVGTIPATGSGGRENPKQVPMATSFSSSSNTKGWETRAAKAEGRMPAALGSAHKAMW